jgi:hypothetical protein
MGWKPSEGKNQASGRYHLEEMEIALHHQIPLVGIYTHIADLISPEMDFGMYISHDGVDLEERLAARAVTQYLATL